MKVFNLNEKLPDLNQYCFVKSNNDWIFCSYNGKTEDHNWIVFRPIALGVIEEWQSAEIVLNTPSIDLINKKATFDLTDVVNGDKESMWKEFIASIQEVKSDDDTDRDNCDLEIGREHL